MKILLCSVPFAPSVGGIETVSAVLAAEFVRRGHAVTVATQTPQGPTTGRSEAGFDVVRRPSAFRLWQLVRRADVVLHNNISLRMAWPLLALDRPWVVAHHTWIGHQGLPARLKRAVLGRALNLAVSRALAVDLPVPCRIVPNPCDGGRFRECPEVARDEDLVFVGRLVGDKGVPVLLQALALARARGLTLRLSVIGEGPDEPALRERCRALGLDAQVRFEGRVVGEALVRRLNAHRALVVPSVWQEPFGLVALEGLACGCMPVVAASGGLPEAAGPAGRIFARGDAAALADLLAQLPAAAPPLSAADRAHLQRHAPDAVAAAYLEALGDALRAGIPLACTA